MANRYWRGGSGTWTTTNTANWSATSGGAGGASVPTLNDSIFFDQAGTYTVTPSGALNCLDFTVSAGTVTFGSGSAPTLNIYGSISMISATTMIFAGGYITFKATTTGKTINTNGVQFNNQIFFDGVGGGWTMTSAFYTSNYITFTNGTFSTGNFALTGGGFTTATGTKSVSLGSSTVSIPNSAWDFSSTTGLTFSAGTSTITSSQNGLTFNGGGLTYYNLSLTSTSVNNTINITGTNTFNNVSVAGKTQSGVGTISLANNQTINGTLTLSAGTNATMRTMLKSNTNGTARTLTVNSFAATSDIDFSNITISGTAAPISGTRFGNGGNNSGITFPAAKTVYWNLAGAQNWSSNGWASTSGGTPAVNNFPLAQDTVVFDNSSNVTGTITIDGVYNIGTLDMSSRTTAMTLDLGFYNIYSYGSWKNGTGVTLTSSNTNAEIIFAGATTQQITSNGISFIRKITINSAGTVQLQDALTIDTTSTTNLISGTLDLNGKTLTTGLFYSNNTNTRTLAFGVGTIAINNATDFFEFVWDMGVGTVTGFTVTGTPNVSITCSGIGPPTIFVQTGTLSEANSINFNFSSGTYDLQFLSNPGDTAGSVDFTGFAGTVNSPFDESCIIYGNYKLSTGMTFTSPGGVTFGATSSTQTITSNGKTLSGPVTINGGGTVLCADAFTLIGSSSALTFTLGTLKLNSSTTNTVGSLVTSGTTLKYLQSTTAGSQATISATTGTNSPTYLYIKDSNAIGGATWSGAGTGIVNGGNNTGWTGLPPVTISNTGNFFLMFG